MSSFQVNLNFLNNFLSLKNIKINTHTHAIFKAIFNEQLYFFVVYINIYYNGFPIKSGYLKKKEYFEIS